MWSFYISFSFYRKYRHMNRYLDMKRSGSGCEILVILHSPVSHEHKTSASLNTTLSEGLLSGLSLKATR